MSKFSKFKKRLFGKTLPPDTEFEAKIKNVESVMDLVSRHKDQIDGALGHLRGLCHVSTQ